MNRIRTAGAAREQVMAGAVNELLDGSVSGSQMADEHALMILGTPLQHRCHKCDAEARAPVSAQVRQARAFVVLVLRQVRVRELSYWYEHERIAKALVSTREREMKIVSLGGELAVVEHGECCDSETGAEEALGTDTRHDANHKGSQDRDHRGTRPQD